MAYDDCLTIIAYRDLDSTSKFSVSQWDEFIRQARRAKVLPRMAWLLKSSNTWSHIPDFAKLHLESAIVSAAALKRTVLWEISHIQKALRDSEVDYVFLKGAAYHLASLPAGEGRIYNDIDFMVAKEDIDHTEQVLNLYGWKSEVLSRYDQLYYRRWTHEIPPLVHVSRGSVIDLHHAILPLTSDLKPDSKLLMQDCQTVSLAQDTYNVLSPVDMVLHSATHLFHEGEFEHGLRDLMDLDLLLRHFDKNEGFWDAIVTRAEQLQLSLPLFYAVRYCQMMLHTAVPTMVVEKLAALHGGRRRNFILDALFLRALLPDHKSCRQKLTSLARFILYVRAHYLRMPPSLLIPHLVRKAFVKN